MTRSMAIFILAFFSMGPPETVAQKNFWEPTDGPYGGRVSTLAINADGQLFGVVALSRYGGNNSIVFSTDRGGSWKKIGPVNTRTQAFSISPRGGIFAGTDEEGIFRSTNNGATWDSVNAGLPTRYIVSLSAKSTDTIFAGRSPGILWT